MVYFLRAKILAFATVQCTEWVLRKCLHYCLQLKNAILKRWTPANHLFIFIQLMFTKPLQFYRHGAKRCRRISASRRIYSSQYFFNGSGKIEAAPQRLEVIPQSSRAIHNYPLSVISPEMWRNNLEFTFLESASSITELQLLLCFKEFSSQIDNIAQGMSLLNEHKFLCSCCSSHLRRHFIEVLIFEADVSFIWVQPQVG